jgi:hypothetical protein
LSSLTSQNIPGFGGNLKSKLDADGGKNRDALLVEIFDYLRCANMQDSTTLKFTNTTDWAGEKNRYFAPRGLMAPSKIEFQNPASPPNQGRDGATTSMGLGAFRPSMRPAWSSITRDPHGNTPTHGTRSAEMRTRRLAAGSCSRYSGPADAPSFCSPRSIRVRLFPQADPPAGESKITYEIEGLENFRVTWEGSSGYTLNFPAKRSWDNKKLQNRIDCSPARLDRGRNMGGYEGFMHTLFGIQYGPKTKIAAADPNTSNENLPVAFYGGNPGAADMATITAATTVPTAPTAQEYYAFQTDLFPHLGFPILISGKTR